MNAPQTALHASISASIVGMERFHEVPDGAAILISKTGVYRQVKVFRRGCEIYAGAGNGFLRLFRNGGTSAPHTRYVGLDLAGMVAKEDALGRVLIEDVHA
jgi:hypothetical protein